MLDKKTNQTITSSNANTKCDCSNISTCINARTVKYLQQLEGDSSNLYAIAVADFEKSLINSVMQYCDNNKSKSAKFLGISRSTLHNKLKNQSH